MPTATTGCVLTSVTLTSGQNKKPVSTQFGHDNRLQEHWSNQSCCAPGLSPPGKQNAGTSRPSLPEELAVPAHNIALTMNDIHEMFGLAPFAPQQQILRVGNLKRFLAGSLFANRADVPSFLDAKLNRFRNVLQQFSLTFFLVCLLFH